MTGVGHPWASLTQSAAGSATSDVYTFNAHGLVTSGSLGAWSKNSAERSPARTESERSGRFGRPVL